MGYLLDLIYVFLNCYEYNQAGSDIVWDAVALRDEIFEKIANVIIIQQTEI